MAGNSGVSSRREHGVQRWGRRGLCVFVRSRFGGFTLTAGVWCGSGFACWVSHDGDSLGVVLGNLLGLGNGLLVGPRLGFNLSLVFVVSFSGVIRLC